MVCRARVFAGVPVRRRVAAQRRAAALARAQMHPAIAGLHAFLALAGACRLYLIDRVEVRAGVWHNPETITPGRRHQVIDGALVAFEEVEFHHAGRPPVLSALSLSVREADTVALVGRSGAGKSTLLKLVNRLLAPTAGRVTVEGRDTRSWDAIRLRRRIGYVIQEVGLFPHLTVAENVGVIPRLERWPASRVAARTGELLDLVGLPAAEFGHRWPHQLSGGQRQRVGVARALAIDPPILLMDEPFGALDPVTRGEVRREFTRLKQRLRTTVLVVTHDIAEAFELGDRVGVLDAGELIAFDTPSGVAASTDVRVRRLIEALPPLRAAHEP
jgi:osmoprotectant transport system ATP-binding protein